MKLSSTIKGGGLFAGAAIASSRSLVEGDLNGFFSVTAAATVTLPKPQDIKAKLGESLLLMSMTDSAVSVALAAGATIDNYTGPIPLVRGLPMDLIVSSGTSWAIRGVQAASDTEITAGTEQSKFLNSLEHAEHHLKGIPGYNHIINGNFDIWQRGTSQTISGYGSDDRWSNQNNGTTKVHSRQAFAVGQMFPDGAICPEYYSRTEVTSVVGASNHAVKGQSIENVSTLAGKKATLSFYAKADAAKKIAVELYQYFGTGGSPSTTVVGIGAQHINLTTAWAKYTVVFDVPSITGKVIGSNGDSKLMTHFWFDSGSTYNARNASLGHQSGTFDIACVSLIEGDKDIKPIPRSYGEVLALCKRYYQKLILDGRVYSSAGGVYGFPHTIPQMRATPILSGVNVSTQNVAAASVAVLDTTIRYTLTSSSAGDCYRTDNYSLDAEL